MKRWIFGMLAGASFVMMLGAAALWVETRASYRNVRFERTVAVEGNRPTWECIDISAAGGVVQAGRMRMSNSPNGTLPARWNVSSHKSPGTGRILPEVWLGFGYFDRTWNASPTIERRTTVLSAPLWIIVPALGIAPTLWTRGALRRRRRAWRECHGLCVGCGYDLRASSAACPECGLEQPAPPQQAMA